MKFHNRATTRSLRLYATDGINHFEIGGHFGLGGLSLEIQKNGTVKTELIKTDEILERFKESNIKDFENSLFLCEELAQKNKEVYELQQEILMLEKQ